MSQLMKEKIRFFLHLSNAKAIISLSATKGNFSIVFMQ